MEGLTCTLHLTLKCPHRPNQDIVPTVHTLHGGTNEALLVLVLARAEAAWHRLLVELHNATCGLASADGGDPTTMLLDRICMQYYAPTHMHAYLKFAWLRQVSRRDLCHPLMAWRRERQATVDRACEHPSSDESFMSRQKHIVCRGQAWFAPARRAATSARAKW